MKNRSACWLLVVASTLVLPATTFAADKVGVCHATGNGGSQFISVAANAVRAHMAHGDALPGETTSMGTPYTGLYGSTVTPMTVVGEDCSTSNVLRIDTAQGFGGTGWAGWSCVETGFPKVVGGGVTPDGATVTGQGPAKPGVTVAGSTYPVYPHYTFIPPAEGWVAQAAPPNPPTGIYVLCGQ